MRRYGYWSRAYSLAKKWASSWAPTMDFLTNTGEDVLTETVMKHGDDAAQLSLAATCRNLRGLVMPRLLKARDQAFTNMYLTGAIG